MKENIDFEKLLVPASIVAAGLIIAGAIVWSGGLFHRGVPAGGKDVAAVGSSGPVGDIAADAPFLGDPKAPVTVVEFSDFQCPFCNRFFRESEKAIIDKYVKTGKVKFVYRHFAFLGAESQWAAEATLAAEEQGKFWQYHDYLFNYIWDNYYAKGRNGENVGAFSKDNLKKFAAELGLDTAKFNAALDSGKFKDAVAKDTAAGRAAGVTGTPTVFINGKMLVGALPLAEFESAIEEALAAGK